MDSPPKVMLPAEAGMSPAMALRVVVVPAPFEPSLGLAPAIVETMYETFGRLHGGGMTILLAEQSVELALEFAQLATVLQVGRSVLAGTAGELAENPEVQRVYMGL